MKRNNTMDQIFETSCPEPKKAIDSVVEMNSNNVASLTKYLLNKKEKEAGELKMATKVGGIFGALAVGLRSTYHGIKFSAEDIKKRDTLEVVENVTSSGPIPAQA